jgi:hypothetical protein
MLLLILAFALTLAETWVATKEGRADRQSTTAKSRRFSIISANWATIFEWILLLDVGFIARTDLPTALALGVVIGLGAWLGKFIALEHRRKKFRTKGLNHGRRRYSVQREASARVNDPA